MCLLCQSLSLFAAGLRLQPSDGGIWSWPSGDGEVSLKPRQTIQACLWCHCLGHSLVGIHVHEMERPSIASIWNPFFLK